MKYFELTLDDPAENLALDEALLLDSIGFDAGPHGPTEILRLWEPRRMMVVVGRSTKIADEVDLDRCRQDDLPVLRRTSGGASVVLGPGCLVFSLVVSFRQRPELVSLERSHGFVLSAVAASLGRYADNIVRQGTSDLALRFQAEGSRTERDQKFSGNSMSRRRDAMLYHGTLLYDFPLPQISRYLRTPQRQPEYRAGRSHEAFVTNFPCGSSQLKTALVDAFSADEAIGDWPRETVQRLVAEKYGLASWNDQR